MVDLEKEIIKVFQSTTNSYKYYWWYAILQLVKKKGNQKFNLEEIALQMMVLAWYPVNYYKLSLGKQDQLATYIKKLKSQFSELKEDMKEEELFLFLHENKNHKVLKGIINKLTKYVPYRFIRPWFDESIGIDDDKVNSLIISLQNSPNKYLPYKINLETNQICLDSKWLDWIYSNIRIIESFTLYELFKYVEKNNPYVTNISLKLFKPQTRKLAEPTKLWKKFIEIKGQEQLSIFEKKPLLHLNKIAIDHYLPWSLVTHDKLWNLHPIEQEVNSSKGNKIADSKYLEDFTYLQFHFVHHISNDNQKYLEDYITLFSISKSELLNIPNRKFTELLSNKIRIETELATNLGYYTKWSYLILD
ncbi:HNH endonuclease domain-containing protein [Flavobacterium saliperosum]|uniref:HNH endonuclease n=1 Tax=Flavobacterium saliperosum TaxID=329186 RepID=A0A1G4V2R5_9FLAO|nr:HNH endonuclease domain-containing protein [Flavobacterium saliperosum]SCX00311.1 HNH endonuclease [Flavobacterium saliperosum]